MDNLLTVKTIFNLKFQSIHCVCPNTEFFLARIFPHSDWIQRHTPNAGKYGPEKTPRFNTFHSVIATSTVQPFTYNFKFNWKERDHRGKFKYFVECVRRLNSCPMSLIALLWIHVCPSHLLALACTLISLLSEDSRYPYTHDSL